MLSSVLFNTFIHDLYEGTEFTISKFEDERKVGGSVDLLEGRRDLQRDLDRLHGWAQSNDRRFNKTNCQIFYVCHSNALKHYRLGTEWLDNRQAERDLEVLVNSS